MASLLSETMVVFLTLIPVIAAETELNYLIASCTVAILLLILCITMAVIFYNCGAIYRSFGYELIPKHERKRVEVMKKLSRHSSEQYLTTQITADRGRFFSRRKMYSVPCTVYRQSSTVYRVQCIEYRVQCIDY
ncbi:uncharacterized protein LOC124264047 [Haliotis rubra]|uniref:uncharacterized protein LOC124264047 n=1 Tax=Haliotis rubra TaxID=36100 RepID=UPI001EE58A4A|nr:uncharacterized protein LOC124264047 [Haliotis rubra]